MHSYTIVSFSDDGTDLGETGRVEIDGCSGGGERHGFGSLASNQTVGEGIGGSAGTGDGGGGEGGGPGGHKKESCCGLVHRVGIKEEIYLNSNR